MPMAKPISLHSSAIYRAQQQQKSIWSTKRIYCQALNCVYHTPRMRDITIVIINSQMVVVWPGIADLNIWNIDIVVLNFNQAFDVAVLVALLNNSQNDQFQMQSTQRMCKCIAFNMSQHHTQKHHAHKVRCVSIRTISANTTAYGGNIMVTDLLNLAMMNPITIVCHWTSHPRAKNHSC